MTIAKGTIASPPALIEVIPLTRNDLEALREPRHNIAIAERLRDPHHNLARLLALGYSQKDAAALSGYSVTRVGQLEKSPAFQELMAQYRNKVNEKFEEKADAVLDLMTANLLKAQRTIAEHFDRADEEGELVPLKSALAVAADAADRVGYSKKQVNLNANVDFAAVMEKAIARSKTITTVPSRAGSAPALEGPPPSSEDSAPAVLSAPVEDSFPRRRIA